LGGGDGEGRGWAAAGIARGAAESNSKVKGNGQECPFHTSSDGANSRFLTGLGARFGMTKIWDGLAYFLRSAFPPGLKPGSIPWALGGAEAPLFHGRAGG